MTKNIIHTIELDDELFHFVKDGKQTFVIVDCDPVTSKIRKNDSIAFVSERDKDHGDEFFARVIDTLYGVIHEDVFRMVPPDRIGIYANPLPMMKRLENFYLRREEGKNFGVLGIHFHKSA